jgi:cation:H+ antiporter
MFFLLRKAFKIKSDKPSEEKKLRPMPLYIFLALLGLGLIVIGGHITVESATYIATALNISERIIGLTIIAIGTSLPELITSLVACKKGENEFALGNIIGSNIFNILFILGIAGLISPLVIDSNLMFDTIFLVAGSLITIFFVYTLKNLSRREGTVMVFMYIGYIAWAVLQ